MVNRWDFSVKDLSAAPPGSPLAFSKIYSLIHLCCCHMASLLPLPPLPSPSITPSIPLPESQSHSSQGPPILVCPSVPLSAPLFPFPSHFLPPCSIGTGPSVCLASARISKVSVDLVLLPSAIDVSLRDQGWHKGPVSCKQY